MKKKGLITMLVLTVFLALSFGFGDTADAKRGGGFKSNKQSFTQKSDSTTQSGSSSSTTLGTKSTTGAGSTAKTGGLFGGGGFMKGMMLGGLAGMLFGGMFANMGGFGQILGLLVNIAAILAIFMVIRAAWTYIRNNKKPSAAGHYQDRNRRDDEDDRNQRGPF